MSSEATKNKEFEKEFKALLGKYDMIPTVFLTKQMIGKTETGEAIWGDVGRISFMPKPSNIIRPETKIKNG
jgi:hypothetical protein